MCSAEVQKAVYCKTCESEERKIRDRNQSRADHKMGDIELSEEKLCKERHDGGGESRLKHRRGLSKHRETNKERKDRASRRTYAILYPLCM